MAQPKDGNPHSIRMKDTSIRKKDRLVDADLEPIIEDVYNLSVSKLNRHDLFALLPPSHRSNMHVYVASASWPSDFGAF